MNVLVTGGAGYIGSHVVLSLLENNFQPIVIDNLTTGSLSLIPKDVLFFNGDIRDSKLVSDIIKNHNIKNVIHLAASTLVPESILNPNKYYLNNTINTIKFLNACGKAEVKNLVFSSTAACYGSSFKNKVDETCYLKPENPYGNSKLAAEMAIMDLAKNYKIFYGIFRFFNVAGADKDLRCGSIQKPASHLIAKACETVLGQHKYIEIFGNDYNTKDGTCIRDYIHVTDVANAHIKALNYLEYKKENFISNLGYGEGYSVKEVLDTVNKVSGIDFKINIADRRVGDISSVIADNKFAINKLNWNPKNNKLDLIIKHELEWTKNFFK